MGHGLGRSPTILLSKSMDYGAFRMRFSIVLMTSGKFIRQPRQLPNILNTNPICLSPDLTVDGKGSRPAHGRRRVVRRQTKSRRLGVAGRAQVERLCPGEVVVIVLAKAREEVK